MTEQTATPPNHDLRRPDRRHRRRQHRRHPRRARARRRRPLGLWADSKKDSDGYLKTGSDPYSTRTYAIATEDLQLDDDVPGVVEDLYGKVRLRATSHNGKPRVRRHRAQRRRLALPRLERPRHAHRRQLRPVRGQLPRHRRRAAPGGSRRPGHLGRVRPRVRPADADLGREAGQLVGRRHERRRLGRRRRRRQRRGHARLPHAGSPGARSAAGCSSRPSPAACCSPACAGRSPRSPISAARPAR